MPLNELLEAVLPYLQGGGQEALPQSTNSLPLPSQEALPQSTNSLPLPSQEGLPRGPNSPALEVGAPEADDWSDVVQMALYEKNLLEVQNQKETLAELIRPLVSEEALRQNYRREKLPSETFIVEQLISRGQEVHPASHQPQGEYKKVVRYQEVFGMRMSKRSR